MEAITLTKPIIFTGRGGRQTKIETVNVSGLKAKHLKLIPASFWDLVQTKQEDGGNKILLSELMPLLSEFVPIIVDITKLTIKEVDELDLNDLTIIFSKIMENMVGESIAQAS